MEKIGETRASRAVQAAWGTENVPQCGYCQSGQVMAATALLAAIPARTDADIDAAMSGNEDELVLWGWEPGGQRAPVSVPHAQFVSAFKDWVSGGMPCPPR